MKGTADMSYELNTILDKIEGSFICVYDGESKIFSSKDEFESSGMEKNCFISSIGTQDGMIVLKLKKLETPVAATSSDWAKEHEKQFRTAPSFF